MLFEIVYHLFLCQIFLVLSVVTDQYCSYDCQTPLTVWVCSVSQRTGPRGRCCAVCDAEEANGVFRLSPYCHPNVSLCTLSFITMDLCPTPHSDNLYFVVCYSSPETSGNSVSNNLKSLIYTCTCIQIVCYDLLCKDPSGLAAGVGVAWRRGGRRKRIFPVVSLVSFKLCPLAFCVSLHL